MDEKDLIVALQHAAVLVDQHGADEPRYILIFERLEAELANVRSRESVRERARRLVRQAA